MCKWLKRFFKLNITELDYTVVFLTQQNGWTEFIFDDGKIYYGEIAEPDSYEGATFFIKWNEKPPNEKQAREFIYTEYKKQWV